MRISRVLIENYRNFQKLLIDPFPPSAVIVGENGVGKTNFLRALRIVLDPELPDSARRLRPEDVCEASKISYSDGVTVRIEVDITDFAGELAAEASLDGCFSSLDPLTARLVYVFEPLVSVAESSGRSLTRDDYTWDISAGIDGDRDGKRIRRDINFTVLQALRDAVGDLSRWRDSPLQDLLELRRPQQDALTNAAEEVATAMETLAREPEIGQLAEELSNRLTSMAGERTDIAPSFGFASSDPDRLLRSLRLFMDRAGTRSVSDASTGNANILYLALLLERSRLRKESGAIVDTILGVEEPEAHLHPVLQRQVFSHLLHEEPSLMVTTHSPHIAAVSRLDSLILLRKVADGSTGASYTSRANFSVDEKEDLERYLDVSRAEVLFCSAAILVEGIAEVYLVPAIAQALGFNLDAYGVIVANIGGTDFFPFRQLLGEGSLDIPHVILTDGDPTNKKGEYLHYGLSRAAKLMSGAAVGEFTQRVEDFLAKDPESATLDLRLEAAKVGVFMGPKTLEVDMAPLLGPHMIKAHDQFSDVSDNLKGKFEAAIEGLRNGDASHQKQLLLRVDSISKGRFAQRLAHHVEQDGLASFRDATRRRISSELLPVGEPWRFNEQLFTDSTYGYLISALDHVSRQVRNYGLFEENPALVASEDR
ncbi:AAA family ATPase [Streptomyces californicus]|uniref:AAA family ATPase n=1 Tax=Streptomyces californicus TaxID=67351 RepID=A0ABD7D1R4_9ACTN|nr:AAA family ATPase [Streptomyces californicus]QRV36711.1 AAA family ATPase [Streptomyces californicus]QRV47778.1 AAA family ATPase [Streptomyces californicus]